MSRQECLVGMLKSQSSARCVIHIQEMHEHDVQHISLTHTGQMLKPRAFKERNIAFALMCTTNKCSNFFIQNSSCTVPASIAELKRQLQR